MPLGKTLDLQRFLDERPVGPFHWRVLIACFTVLVLDGFDVVAIGFIAPAIVTEWHLPRQALGPVLTAGLFGLAIGAIAGGPLADRFGRKRVIVGACVWFGVASLLSAWSPDLWWLTVFRFLTGLGLGASQPNAATLISEYAPRHRRALFVSVTYCGFTLGAAGGGFLSAWLIGLYGWQSILLIGGVAPIAFATAMLVVLPESARFLLHHQPGSATLRSLLNRIQPGAADPDMVIQGPSVSQAEQGTVRKILTPPTLAMTLTLWGGLFVSLLTVYLLNSWLPIIVRDAGFTLEQAAFMGAMGQVGGTVGNVVIGWLMDRWEPHRAQFTILLLAAACAVAIGLVPRDITVLMLPMFLLGFCVNSANTGWTALAAGSYPSAIRATGTGVMTGIGRMGAVFGAWVGGVILAFGWTFGQIFTLLAVPIGIGMAAVLLKARFHHAPADPAITLPQHPGARGVSP